MLNNITLGDLIAVGAVLLSFFVQYISFSNRFSHFEGYTKAKLETFEKSINALWSMARGVNHEEKIL